MKQKSNLIGQLRFRTEDGNHALVSVYRGNHTFTARRIMADGRTEERSKSDPYNGDLANYISEAMLVWKDLKPDGVDIEPKS